MNRDIRAPAHDARRISWFAKAPVFLSETPGSIRHRAPMLGEHTDEILTELGYRTDEIVALREKRVI